MDLNYEDYRPSRHEIAEAVEHLIQLAELGQDDSIDQMLRSYPMYVGINSQNDRDTTCLIAACKRNDYRLAQFLLSRGADPKLGNIYGNTPLSLAQGHQNEALIILLQRALGILPPPTQEEQLTEDRAELTLNWKPYIGVKDVFQLFYSKHSAIKLQIFQPNSLLMVLKRVYCIRPGLCHLDLSEVALNSEDWQLLITSIQSKGESNKIYLHLCDNLVFSLLQAQQPEYQLVVQALTQIGAKTRCRVI